MADDSTSIAPTPSPRPVGRPTKYTDETREKILQALRDGATRRAAAAVAGINAATLHEWANEYPEFSESLTCAENECEAEMSRLLKTAATTDWRAAESWLKRRRREDYGDNTVTMLKGFTDEQLFDIATGGAGRVGAKADEAGVAPEAKTVIQVVYADDTTTTASRSTAGD